MELSTIARRFPLAARPRPACSPLPERVTDLRHRAQIAARDHDTGAATAVFNLAALLASDCGLPHLARDWCRRLAHAALQPGITDAAHAIHALEPVVNLARLHTRAGDGAAAWQLLETLYHGIQTHTDTLIDGVLIPLSSLTDPAEHRELQTWLWAVLLADGARALAVAGRWDHARQRLTRYHGIGHRMLDGRQIAVLADALAGNTDSALALIRDTQPGAPWEDAVTSCLRLMCQAHPAAMADLDRALAHYQPLESNDGIAVFRTRLGLSLIDACSRDWPSLIGPLATRLVDLTVTDGYAARDILTHPHSQDWTTRPQRRALAALVEACSLDAQELPDPMLAQLTDALDQAETVVTAGHTISTP